MSFGISLVTVLITSPRISPNMQPTINQLLSLEGDIYPLHATNLTMDVAEVVEENRGITYRPRATKIPTNELLLDSSQSERQTSTADSGKMKDMNVVLLYADDWSFTTLGINNPAVKTPNLDRLAKNGVWFPYNSVTSSVCWQSRATLLTGMYVAVHQFIRISSMSLFDQTVRWTNTLYAALKKNGYHVGFVGKWHAPLPKPFQNRAFHFFRAYYGEHWMRRDKKRRHITDLNGADALEYLRSRPPDQKFALTVAFYATHTWNRQPYPNEYQPQPYSENLYINTTLSYPKTATNEHWKKMPWFFTENSLPRKYWQKRYSTIDKYQETVKRIYRMASEVDDVIGNLVEELQKQGVYDKTMIIFTSDNGNFMSEHTLAGKWMPHEESVRVPLIVYDPRLPESQRGQVNTEFTLNIDLAPTILAAAGIPIPASMQGRDMSTLYLGENTQAAAASWRKEFFYEWIPGLLTPDIRPGKITHIPAVFGLIGKVYKYFVYPQAHNYRQLFHVGGDDPFEEHDIFNATLQQNPDLIHDVEARYAYWKNLSRLGYSV